MEKALIKTLQLETVIDRLFGDPKHRDAAAFLGPNNECIIRGTVCGALTLMVYEQESNYINVTMLTAPDNKIDWELTVSSACSFNGRRFKTFEDELFYDKEGTYFAGYQYTYYRM